MGTNTITVLGIAEDITIKIYTITITRAAAALSDNADLGGLTISSGTLSPSFSSSDIAYTASVDNSVTQVTVTPTASDSSATIVVNGITVTSGNGYIVTGLTVGEPTTVTVIVAAQDSTTKTYTVTLTRAAALSDTPPTFVSSKLDSETGVLTIIFSEDIDATPNTRIVPDKIHIRESGSYTGGVTLTAGELGTTADGTTISFTLNVAHLKTVAELSDPKLTIDPGAVQDTFGNLIEGTFDVSTATYVRKYSVESGNSTLTDVEFSNDGTKMFIVGGNRDDVTPYALIRAFDLTHVSPFGAAFSLSPYNPAPQSLEFSNDGTKMFVVGIARDNVTGYALSTAFDVSTATYVNAFNVRSEDHNPQGLAFSNDGTKMFVVGQINKHVYEYTLPTAFDVSTAVHVYSFPIGSDALDPFDVEFSNDGTKMFVVDRNLNNVHQYTLSTAFDVSTAVHVNAFNVGFEENSPRGVAFSNNGTKMFVVGSHSSNVNEYALSSVYPLSVVSNMVPADDHFVTTWRTGADNETVTIPVYSGLTYYYTVIWGDGSTDTGVTGDASHTYAAAGDHQVRIYGIFLGIHLDGHADASKLASIDQWGSNRWASMASAFKGASSMKYEATDAPDLSGVTDMTRMFSGAESFDGDLSNWNVSQVTDMSYMFSGADAFDGDISSWSVSQVTDMSSMFSGADAFDGDISSWSVSQVTDMSYMFSSAESFDGDLSNWNVSQVTDMSSMFAGADAFDGDISSWSVSQVTDMSYMFSSADNFNQPLNGWVVSSVNNMNGMFGGASSFTQNLGEWYVTLDPDTIADTGIPGVVGTISAQNQPLRDHVPTYGIVDGLDKNHFEIVPGNQLNMISGVSEKAEYSVNVTASGTNVFESGNNWRVLVVKVSGDINAPPVLNTIDDQTVNEFVELTFTATASDDDSLTFSFDGTFPSGAAITDDGNFTWTPTELQDGDHTITVQVTDGSLTDSETLTVTVNEVNVAPVLSAIGDKGTSELVELTFTATASDTDVVDNVVNTLTFSFDGTFPSGAAITDDGNFTWTPTESQVGSHDITVQVTDGSLTDSETLTVTVRDVNAPPVLNTIDDQTVNEFVELTFTAIASDDDSLTFSFDGTFPSGAAITDDGNFTWTPTELQDGDHTITVQVTDGSLTDSETLTVTVNEVNVAPVLSAIGDKGTSKLVELTFTATASDTDVVDNVVNTLTFSFDGTFPSGAAITDDGNFTWTPTESQVGSHDITVQVTDGSLTDSETLTVTVRDVNAPPVLNTIDDQTVNEFVELTFTATASDDDSLTFSFDGTFPSGAAITDDGNFTWTPTELQDGDHTITVQVTDGSLTDSETLTVTVNEVNVAPVLSAIGDKGTSKLVELTFTATASDTDVVDNVVNTLTFSFDGTFPSGAAITDDGNFTWTPTESQVGSHDITVQVTDGSLTDSETLTVTVRDVNAPPVLNTIDDQTVNEFVELTFTATASDDDSLTFSFDGTFPSGAAITDDGNFTWTPTELQDGDHTITVQVTDGSLTDSETLTVTVNEVNVAPVLSAIGDKGTSELVELTFTATASDTDVVDNVVNTLTFSFDGTFPLGAAIMSAGVFTWTPTESQVGSHDITVQVTDGSLTDSETLTVTVKDTTAPDTILPADAFITTWRTDSANQTITIPVGGSTARYSIDWGDNSPAETDITGDSTHTYREADSYTVSISGGLERFHLDGQQPNAGRLASIEQWGDTKWTTMNGAFDGAANMVYNATDSPDLGLVSDMSYMFAGAAAFDGDLSSWDVSSVTNMFDMFSGATSFDQPLNDWDVSSVTEMDGMFAIATSFNQSLNDWDVSSVTDMAEMFYSASDFNQPLNDWDVSSVTEMDGMFAFAYDFNGDLSSWDVSSVTEMDGMFYYASDFNQPLNDWDVSSVTDMAEMFYYATSFNQPLNSWDVSSVDNMARMFNFATAFSQNLGEWYVTLDPDTIADTGIPGVVGTISAQNQPLKNHSPTYVIVDGLDKNHFEIVPGNQLNMISGVSEKAEYSVNVTASGESVFESGNNWRLLVVSVSAALSDNADLGGLTISSGTLSPQFSSSDITYTASVDNSVTQVTVTPTASDSSATITVNDNTVTSGNGYIVIGLIAGEPNTVTVIVTAQDSTTKTYTITLTRAASLSGNADLGSLTISSGTLSPQFSSSDITYTASVDNSVTQVTVTPTASDSSATITVNDNTVTSGNGYIVIGLIAGEPNTVTVIVTAQDSTTKTYTITLTRAASLSDNADLGSLTISSGTLSPQFSSSDITYTASVDNSVTQVTVTPTASDSSATITVNDNTVTSGNGYIVIGLIAGEPNTVTVIVTAQDSTTKTYTITLTRAASLSGNADLGGLTISSGTLSPQFSSSDITYTASVDNSVTQVTVTPTASDSSATITVNDNTVTSGNGYIVIGLIAGEPNTVTVIVTAQDSTTKTYTITLTRAASLSGNADLGGLTISSGTLSPQFSSSDITYTASVDNSVTQVTVTPTASDSSAAITVNDNTVTSGNGYIVIGLIAGEPNTVTVIVTAQDSTTKTYTITLTRAASLSGNADLGGLTISSGTLSPQFSSSDITYTASVDNSVTQVTVTPTASDSSATITVNDNTVTSGNGYIVIGLIAGEPNTVTVIVTAQDSTTKTYTITLTRAASLSDNADLGSLTISSGTLSPQFSSSDITYTASVDNSVTQVTVTPTASDSSATITVNDNTVTSGNGYIVIGLIAGEPNTVTVIVTAQDSTTKTYIITVTVRDVPITVSSAAYNPGNGQLTITFNQDIATVDYSRLHVRSSANPDTGGITLSSVTGADYSGRTITATLDSEQQDQYDALQSPHLVVEDGAVTDTDGDRTTDVQPQPIRDASQKGSSSSPSSKASIVHINALAQSRLVDIPPHIAEQVESHDASDPLEPITPDGTFDLPLVINGYGYLLDAYENTLIPQTVTAGDNPVHITFTVYTEKEFAHFILYLNLQGRNTNYADSDTYITYKDDGTTSITDPHGYIGSATVTVTQEDDQIPEKRTVRITIEFEEPMGPTNMVAYMWNTDREALFVKIIDALEVVAASPESAMQAADPEPLEPDSVLPADPEPVTPDFADDAADPEPVPYDILGPDDYDDTQILQIIRMWSGFESESITDEQLLELLGLDDHQGADIPDWMMTELGVLVAKGTVTVDEFLVALQYVLEHV